jgi:hypothetical protein
MWSLHECLLMNIDTDTKVGKCTFLAKWITRQNFCSLSFSDYVLFATYHCVKFHNNSVSQNYVQWIWKADATSRACIPSVLRWYNRACYNDLISLIFNVSLIATVCDKSSLPSKINHSKYFIWLMGGRIIKLNISV